MPVACDQCSAINPPLSSFCHRCGATLSPADDIPHHSTSRQSETTFRDVATDLKALTVNTALYTAPRMRRAANFVARAIRRSATYAGPRIKATSRVVARQAKRPTTPPKALVPRRRLRHTSTPTPSATTLPRHFQKHPQCNDRRQPSKLQRAHAAKPSTKQDPFSASTADYRWMMLRPPQDRLRTTPATRRDSGSGSPQR